MGKQDNLTKEYMRDPERFADFFNGLMYGGNQEIDWRSLQELDSTSIVNIPISNSKSIGIQKIRDIIKAAIIMKSDSKYFVLLGIENQNDIHYAMPVRTMLYNALTYTEQVATITRERKESGEIHNDSFLSGFTKYDKLKPVVTVTLYWGSQKWDAPVSLKEMLLDMDSETQKLVDDCNINLFSIIDLMEIPKYRTDLKEIISLLNARNDGNKMKMILRYDDAFKSMTKIAAQIVSSYTNTKMPKRGKDGDYNMCKAVMEIKEEGIMETLASLVKDGIIDVKEAAKRANVSEEKFQKFLEKINEQDIK